MSKKQEINCPGCFSQMIELKPEKDSVVSCPNCGESFKRRSEDSLTVAFV